jgi:oligopeptide/dipeptide ABC transporter ATP-binding protein
VTSLLEIRGLDVSFATDRGEVHVLRNVSLDIGRGRIVGIVGESGSGKSTLATSILRLLPANLSRLEGEILFEGVNLLSRPEAELRRLRGNRISMIFQDPMSSLNPVFTIETHMIDVQRAKGPGLSRREMRARAIDMLHKVGIPDARRRISDYPHQFSGGMRQRIMISMALLTEPALLIADEPTTALDVTIEAQIVRLLERLRAELDVSIIFISHSLGLVSELCDDVVVMYAGTVVESAPAEELFRNPRHPYTRALLESELSTRDEGSRRLHSIAGEVPDLVTVPSGCIFVERCGVRIPVCRTDDPGLRPAGPEHRAACVHVGSA